MESPIKQPISLIIREQTIRSAENLLEFIETDQADPAGRWRFRLDGDKVYFERATAANWASDEDWAVFDKANERVDFGKTARLTSPTIQGAVSAGTGLTLPDFNMNYAGRALKVLRYTFGADGEDLILESQEVTRPATYLQLFPLNTSVGADRSEITIHALTRANAIAGNVERLYLEALSDRMVIVTEAKGTGTLRPLVFGYAPLGVGVESARMNIDGTWTWSKSVTLPLPTITGGMIIQGGTQVYSDANNAINYFRGGLLAAGGGSWIALHGVGHASPGLFSLSTPDAAGTGDIQRLSISGKSTTAIATWTSVTHTGIKLSGALDANLQAINSALIADGVTADPTADATQLGRIIRSRSGAGVATAIKMCCLNSANGYEWVQIGLSS
jgi:hypothetical protein